MDKKLTTLHINKTKYQLPLEGHETLLEVLRDQIGLTGTKSACSEAECGACTVLIDGQSVLSCITLACDVEGRDILTIEGLSQNEELHPVQQAFLEKGAVQCGFCIPGMILSSHALLSENPQPETEQIQKSIDGHICRCAGYHKMIDAVKYAGELIAKKERES